MTSGSSMRIPSLSTTLAARRRLQHHHAQHSPSRRSPRKRTAAMIRRSSSSLTLAAGTGGIAPAILRRKVFKKSEYFYEQIFQNKIKQENVKSKKFKNNFFSEKKIHHRTRSLELCYTNESPEIFLRFVFQYQKRSADHRTLKTASFDFFCKFFRKTFHKRKKILQIIPLMMQRVLK
jgi:hypothetical protein